MVKIPFFKNGFLAEKKQEATEGNQPATETLKKEEEISRQEIELLKIVLLRYREHIESNESKSIIEMKGMIKPYDASILAERDNITAQFHPYIYQENFLDAAKLACVRAGTIKTVSLPLNFWLSYDDMISIGAADEIGKAMLLCSFLRSLDSQDAKVAICNDKTPLVFFTFNQKAYICLEGEGIIESGEGADIAAFRDKKISYTFNDIEYTDKSEGE